MAKIHDLKVPAVGESITEVTLSRYIVAEGTYVEEGKPLVELETDKANVEVPAPATGFVSYTKKEGDTIVVGESFGSLKEGAAPPKDGAKPAAPIAKPEPAKAPQPAKVVTPPEAKSVNVESGIRIEANEYLKDAAKGASIAKPSATSAKESAPKKEDKERKPMSKLRKIIAHRLVKVKNETAMLTTFNEVDMSAIIEIRNREKDDFVKRYGVKLSFLPFFVKAAALALKEFPDVNAFIEGEDIIYYNGVHMGIAVSTDKGLVVPVIRSVQALSFVGIAEAIQDLATKARDRKLTPDDMAGGTFTITNGGVFGSMLSTPILNPPQSAILGMHNIVERPVAIKGQVVIRPIMYLALSYDHRIIDGKDSVSFLVRLKELLEDPAKLIIAG